MYKFKKDPISGMILVYIQTNENHEFKMMLDTGASNTTFDLNALLMANFPINNILNTGMAETAGGIIEVDIIKTETISAFGHTVKDMKVQVYDFIKHGILSDYDGLLGLDFFEDTEFTINMKNQTIEVKK
ncbi:MAG: retroviral-like aspartic protease family protein [Marinilabiliaceae bacterium]|nr:retroviral-like aspartic protease family protein [Marinilabiliaceae bacterium]